MRSPHEPLFEDPYPHIDWAPLIWRCRQCDAKLSAHNCLELGADAQSHMRSVHQFTGPLPHTRIVKNLRTSFPWRSPARDDAPQSGSRREYISPKTRWEVMKRDGFKCKKCGKTHEDERLEVDHVIPASKGGTSEESNLEALCVTCNRGKGDRP